MEPLTEPIVTSCDACIGCVGCTACLPETTAVYTLLLTGTIGW
jgi:hypothetical protein